MSHKGINILTKVHFNCEQLFRNGLFFLKSLNETIKMLNCRKSEQLG